MNGDRVRHTAEQLVIFCILAAMVSLGFWFIVEKLSGIEPEQLGVLLPVYGIVVAKFADSVGYFIHTSLGSARKNDKLKKDD